ncbi:Phosphoenolpyruvate-protein phosphotransferase of PTS system [Chitinispirillum alkaliphilum]|nr:Phosphoenolpyruvate-protein phosphotransferase of PTS system [Chitinispirillum alkaliphilum]
MSRFREKTRRELYGESISPGVAIADALQYKPISLDALEMNSFPVEDISKELNRLDYAIAKSRNQLIQIFQRLSEKDNSGIHDIFKVQLQLLEDRSFLEELKQLLSAQKMNIEHVIASQMRVLETRFRSITDEALRTKFMDIQDAYQRILRNLLEIEHVRTNPMQRIEKPVVFVSEKLLPSDVALLDFKKIEGIIIEEGSRLSHVAVISKSMGIPAIIRTPGAGTLIRSGDPVIVDGYTGKVIVYPDAAELSSYKEKREHFVSRSRPKLQQSQISKPCRTKDGRRVKLEANIGSVKEAQAAVSLGAEGVGLLRSELFYMSFAHRPTINEETDFYQKISSIIHHKPLTIRVLDLGADKSLPFLQSYEEENPQLGIRGIRYLLKNKDLFRDHISSIIPLCKIAPIKIALPFISVTSDLEKALEIINQVCREQKVEREIVKVGIMVEIPSVALSIHSFLSKVDFVNIGTNDLIQYTFAASREDSDLEEYRQSVHPVILRLIRSIARTGMLMGKEVSVCGEAAGEAMSAALLVGAGISSLSMQPNSIPIVKEALSNWRYSDLKKLSRKALQLETNLKVTELLEKFSKQQNGV